MARRVAPRTFIDTSSPEELRRVLTEQTAQLNELSGKVSDLEGTVGQVRTCDYDAQIGELVRVDPGVNGVRIRLPAPQLQRAGAKIDLFLQGTRGPVTLEPVAGTINGLPELTFLPQVGIATVRLDGTSGWMMGGMPAVGVPAISVDSGGGASAGASGLQFVNSSTVSWAQLVTNTIVAISAIVIDRSISTVKIALNAVTNSELADAPAVTLKGNPTESEADPQDIPLGTHTFPLRAEAGIVARSLFTFFANGITYDDASNTVSVDAIDVGLEDSNEGLEDDGTTVGIANLGVTTAKLADLAVTTLKLNDLAVTTAKIATAAVTGVKVLTNTLGLEKLAQVSGNVAVGTFSTGTQNVTTKTWATFFGDRLTYNTTTGVVSADNQTDALDGDRHVTRVGNNFGLDDVIGHSFLARQSGTTGQLNTATIAENQVAGRPGSGAIQGTQVLTDMIASLAVTTAKIAAQAVTFAKIENQNANSFMGRFTGTTGEPSSLSIATHSFPAREGGNLFTKSFSSLAGANLSYNSGTGELEAGPPGDTVPSNFNSVITRNGSNTLTATSMSTNSIMARAGGAPASFALGSNDVLRSVGGTMSAGLLATANLGNAIVTAAKILTSDTFSWGGAQTFASQVFWTATQTSTIGSGTVVTLAGFVNTLRVNVSSGDSLAGMTGGSNGRKVTIMNTSATEQLIITANSGAAGTNGFGAATGFAFIVEPGATTDAQYDGTSSRWRVNCTTLGVVG